MVPAMEGLRQRVSKLVAQDDLRQAILLLITQGHSSANGSLLLGLQARLSRWEKDKALGVASRDDLNRERNQILEAILIFIGDFLPIEEPAAPQPEHMFSLEAELRTLLDALEKTYSAFEVQAQLRNRLYRDMAMRLGEGFNLEYETFFSRFYDQMELSERRLHQQIRGLTRNPMAPYNNRVLEALQAHPGLKMALPRLSELEDHLLIWQSKFQSLFEIDSSVSLVYVGVEEGKPFPAGIEAEIAQYLKSHFP